MGYGMMGFGVFAMLFNLLIVIGIVVLIVWAVKRFSTGNGSGSHTQTPREILQARYARGEITREQYQEMLKDIS